jgi:hypothetical protein
MSRIHRGLPENTLLAKRRIECHHKPRTEVQLSRRCRTTGRERLHRILNRQATDRLSWTTLVDPITRSAMPEEAQRLSPIEFYRAIGCDILQFGNYGLGEDLAVLPPSRLVGPEVTCEINRGADGLETRRRISPWGTLTTVIKYNHPLAYPVKSLEDMRILRAIWEASDFVEQTGMEETLVRLERQIGEHGMYVPTLDPSPVQDLLENEMGAAVFYYLLNDHRREVEELLAIMHAKRLKEYEILARRSPAEVVIPVENTSSTLISPRLYRTYSLPQIRDYVDILHRYGKKAVLHMCGHLKALLPVLRETGLDGINAVTPPPVGTTFYEDVLDSYGEDFVLFGAVLNPALLHKPGLNPDELSAFLDRLYTPRLRQAHMVLWVTADGLPTPLEKFSTIARWMEKQRRTII